MIHVMPSLYVTADGRETDAPSPDRMTERVYEPLAFDGAWTRSCVDDAYEVADALVPPTVTIDPGAKFVPVTTQYPSTLEVSAVSSMDTQLSSVIWTLERVMGWDRPVNCDPSPTNVVAVTVPVAVTLPAVVKPVVKMVFTVVSTFARLTDGMVLYTGVHKKIRNWGGTVTVKASKRNNRIIFVFKRTRLCLALLRRAIGCFFTHQ